MVSTTSTASFQSRNSANRNNRGNNKKIVASVLEVCEGLWSVQNATQARPWLQIMYETLHNSAMNYDPSEVFLSLQGAALRFPDSIETWELALWCTAALVRACVGPAWRLQRLESPMPQTSASLTTFSDSSTLESSPQPQTKSPRSHSVISSSDNQPTSRSYPYIPQVLPGAILRFAASSPGTRNLAEAQRELVMHLVCTDDDNEYQPKWSVPGSHETVQTMVMFWLESTTSVLSRKAKPGENKKAVSNKPNSASKKNPTHISEVKGGNEIQHSEFMSKLQENVLDWWQTLKVARACSDLLSTDWRPDNIVVVLYLMNIAQQGIQLFNISPNATDRETREERLAATSSAAEAMAALASLGSKGRLSPSHAIVISLLEIQVLAGQSTLYVHSLYPFPEVEHLPDIWLQEREEFISQRSSCFADTADLLWVLLAQETQSSSLVMTTLLKECPSDYGRASVVVRIVSWALWGKPPNVRGIPALRIYWVEFLDILKELVLKCFVEVVLQQTENKKLDKNGMTLALEIVVALRRLIETEMIRGSGILIKDEWNKFHAILSDFIIPSIRLSQRGIVVNFKQYEGTSLRELQKILKHIRSESEVLLGKLGEYLRRCASFERHHYHLIVDDDTRNGLHFLLLRRAAPFLPKTGTVLAINVLKSWSAIGFLPNHRITWMETAKAIMADAFAIHDNAPLSLYDGYIHSPLVRLESLLILSREYTYKNKSAKTSDSRKTIGSIHPSSPLGTLKIIPDEYLKMVKNLLLPILNLVLERHSCKDESISVFQYTPAGLPPHILKVDDNLKNQLYNISKLNPKSDRIMNESYKLRKYAIELVGVLFCDENITKSMRMGLIDTLKGLSMLEPVNLQKNNERGLPDDSTTASLATIVTTRSLISLEAVGQLESCLCAPFFSFSHTHESIPSLIIALCSVLDYYSNFQYSKTELSTQKQQESSHQLLSCAALLPLARLRRSQSGGLLLVERDKVMVHLPEGITALFNERHFDSLDDAGPFIAPFASVNSKDKNKSTTFVSFQPILTTLIEILQSSSYSRSNSNIGEAGENEQDKELERRFRSCCYDTLLNYILSGLSFSELDLFAKLVSLPTSTGPYSGMENFARIRVSMAVFQCAVLCLQSKKSNNSAARLEVRNVEVMVAQLLQICRSQIAEEAINGCSLLVGLFPSIVVFYNENRERLQKIYHLILLNFVSCTDNYVKQMKCKSLKQDLKEKGQLNSMLDYGPSILFCLYESTLYYFDLFRDLELKDCQNIIRLCYEVASNISLSRSCRTLAVRCAVTVLDRMKKETILNLWPQYSQNFRCDLSSSVSTASQLEILDSDQIVCAMQYKLLNLKKKKVSISNSRQAHLIMAKEVENLKSFDQSKDVAAAWLFGDHLLVCKIGTKNSRYCGWVELSIRGASFRHRELIRLPQAASIERPDLPSLLWDYPGKYILSKENEKHHLRPLSVQPIGDVEIQALTLLDRCDEVLGIGNLPHNLNLESRRRGETKHCATSRQESSTLGIKNINQYSLYSWLQDNLGGKLDVDHVVNSIIALGLASMVESEVLFEGNIERPSCTIAFDPILRLKMDSKMERAMNLLDRIVPLNTHKIALMFASPPNDQVKDDETEIDFYLTVKNSSPLFFEFARGLGELVMTRHLKYFSAGLDTSGNNTDGEFALIWIEDIESIHATSSACLTIYHTIPFMPENLNNRKRHIGNDSVHIIFVDPTSYLHERLWSDGQEEEMENSLIAGEFGFITIFVLPTNNEAYRIKVQLKPDLPEAIWLKLHHLPGENVITKEDAPQFVRRIANLADIACASAMCETFGPPTSWESRISQLRLMTRHAL